MVQHDKGMNYLKKMDLIFGKMGGFRRFSFDLSKSSLGGKMKWLVIVIFNFTSYVFLPYSIDNLILASVKYTPIHLSTF